MMMLMLLLIVIVNDDTAADRMGESLERAIGLFHTSPMPYIIFVAILAPFVAFCAALKIHWRRCEARERRADADGDENATRIEESRRGEDGGAERPTEPEVGRSGTFADLCLDEDACASAASHP